jgi:hypothetical protein
VYIAFFYRDKEDDEQDTNRFFMDRGATMTMPKVAVLCHHHHCWSRSHPKAGMAMDRGATSAKKVTDLRGDGVCVCVCMCVYVTF